MKKFALIVLFTLFTAPAWATNYFLAPASAGGNDSNNGTSASAPWLSPNHSVNCGDVITAAASSSYSSADFGHGKWGSVSCAAGNNVAWLKCATFDACKLNGSSSNGMIVDKNYWGVQGWEVTTSSSSFYGCFEAAPPNSSTSIHHIIFANDIANGCGGGGFTSFASGSAGADYVVYVGNIAYNSASNGTECFSGLNIYEPKQSDAAGGTHMYVAGNFSYANVDADPCAGGTPTDGEGLIFDTFDGSQGSGNVYTQQAVAYNNMFLGNGGRGFQSFNNKVGSSHSPIYVEYNTSWGNETDGHQNSGGSCGEIRVLSSLATQALHNISETTSATGCGGFALSAYYVATSDATVVVDFDWGYSPTGNNCGIQSSGSFACGSHNLFGANPSFSSPSVPGAPNCGSTTSVTNCMATVISNFKPTTSGASAYGYQVPLTTNVNDPLFPQWLCNVNLPSGLVTMGCASSASSPAPPTNINVSVQ